MTEEKSERQPEFTCASEITGKVVRVRHAVEADMVFIEEIARKYGLEVSGIGPDQFVVAEEDGHIMGFGRMSPVGQGQFVELFTMRKEKALKELMLRHLLEYAP